MLSSYALVRKDISTICLVSKQSSHVFYIFNFWGFFSHSFACVHVHVCGRQRTVYGRWLSSTCWVSGFELRSSDLAANLLSYLTHSVSTLIPIWVSLSHRGEVGGWGCLCSSPALSLPAYSFETGLRAEPGTYHFSAPGILLPLPTHSPALGLQVQTARPHPFRWMHRALPCIESNFTCWSTSPTLS